MHLTMNRTMHLTMSVAELIIYMRMYPCIHVTSRTRMVSEDLKEMKVPIGPRKKMLASFAGWFNSVRFGSHRQFGGSACNAVVGPSGCWVWKRVQRLVCACVYTRARLFRFLRGPPRSSQLHDVVHPPAPFVSVLLCSALLYPVPILLLSTLPRSDGYVRGRVVVVVVVVVVCQCWRVVPQGAQGHGDR